MLTRSFYILIIMAAGLTGIWLSQAGQPGGAPPVACSWTLATAGVPDNALPSDENICGTILQQVKKSQHICSDLVAAITGEDLTRLPYALVARPYSRSPGAVGTSKEVLRL